MRLSDLRTDPDRFQFRDKPFDTRTVEAIVKEGIDTARFDPVPIILENGHGIVAGDGHSRLEAVKRLAITQRLPSEWQLFGADTRRNDWEIPTREVRLEDALRLAYVANMGRSPFRAVEEARIFQARLNAGETMDEIAASSHVSSIYVQKRLRLNCLCQTFREAVGQAWGIDVDKAIVFAEACERHDIGHATQQQLWLRVICKGDWTMRSLKLFMDRIGPHSRPSNDGGSMLFEMPPNIETVVETMSIHAQDRRRARRGMQWLIQSVHVLDDADLQRIIRDRGKRILSRIKEVEAQDAEALGALVL